MNLPYAHQGLLALESKQTQVMVCLCAVLFLEARVLPFPVNDALKMRERRATLVTWLASLRILPQAVDNLDSQFLPVKYEDVVSLLYFIGRLV